MDYQMLMDVSMRVGEIMLAHGAEAHRVEDTMYRILRKAGLETTEVFVIMTGIIATISNPGMETITQTKRVRSHGNNLKYICFANEISRQFCDDVITLAEAYEKLSKGCRSEYPRIILTLGNLLIVFTFPILVGGTYLDCLFSLFPGIILVLALNIGQIFRLHSFLLDLIASFLAAAAYLVLHRLLPLDVHQDAIIVACIMPLVPGVAITNAIRDTLNGDYVSGGARAMEAFIKAAGIAIGVGVGLTMLGGVMG